MSNGNPIIIETNTLQAELEGPHYRPADIFQDVERQKQDTREIENRTPFPPPSFRRMPESSEHVPPPSFRRMPESSEHAPPPSFRRMPESSEHAPPPSFRMPESSEHVPPSSFRRMPESSEHVPPPSFRRMPESSEHVPLKADIVSLDAGIRQHDGMTPAEENRTPIKWEEKWDTQGKWKTIKPGESVAVPEAVETEIRERLLGVLFSQTVDILDREIGTAADLELGCRLAFAFRQGPLELMRELGEVESQRILTKFTSTKPGMPGAQRPLCAYQDFYRFVLVDELDGVKIITLRRPEALNAIHDDMIDEILTILKKHENDPQTTGFIITGYGGAAFSAGADIGKFPSMLGDRKQSVDYARVCSRLLVCLDNCKKPVIAALNGMALGGGLELVIRCHGIVAAKNAWLQFPEITLGIAPGLGGMVIPYRRWPAAATVFHTMLLKAERMTVTDAVELGIINILVDSYTTLLPSATRLVRELAQKQHVIADTPVNIAPPVAVEDEPLSFNGQRLSARTSAIIRQAIIDAAAAPSLDEALEIGYAAFGESACTAAASEGISAFTEKRKPDFTGI